MKKLMVMALIAGAAVTTFGAATTWSTGWTYWTEVGGELSNEEGGTDQFVGNAYLFTGLSEAQYQALTSAADIWDNFTAAGDDSTLKIGANTLTVTDWGALVDGGLDFSKTGAMEFPAGSAYAAVVVTHEEGGVVDAYSANAVYATSGLSLEGADQVALTWGDGRSIGTPTTWQANSVPEPTSGLLLLLGVAGLALRRRRA